MDSEREVVQWIVSKRRERKMDFFELGVDSDEGKFAYGDRETEWLCNCPAALALGNLKQCPWDKNMFQDLCCQSGLPSAQKENWAPARAAAFPQATWLSAWKAKVKPPEFSICWLWRTVPQTKSMTLWLPFQPCIANRGSVLWSKPTPSVWCISIGRGFPWLCIAGGS